VFPVRLTTAPLRELSPMCIPKKRSVNIRLLKSLLGKHKDNRKTV